MAIFGLVLVACTGDRALDPEASYTAPAPKQVLPNDLAPSQITTTATCLSDGDFDFVLTASVLAIWESVSVHVIAYEPSATGNGPTRIPARVSGVITNGQFVASCPHALRENYAYPSVGIFVDANGDGHCDAGDVGAELQFYGWDQALAASASFDVPGIATGPTWPPVAALQGRVGSDGNDFCSAYFPAD